MFILFSHTLFFLLYSLLDVMLELSFQLNEAVAGFKLNLSCNSQQFSHYG